MKPVDGQKAEPGNTYPRRIYLAFAALALLSCLGLDFLAARRGEPAYLFTSRRPTAAPAPAAVPVPGSVDRLPAPTAPAEKPAERGRDEGARPRPEAAAQPAPITPSAPSARPEKTAAIIIDDMGNSLDALQEIFDLDIPITVSVLPRSPYALETARAAHERRLEVMLHLPCESLNHQDVLEPLSPVIRSDMPPDEIRALVSDSLDSLPFVSGVNNHMGSKLTQDRTAMIPVLDVIKQRGLFFIDSVTGGRSIAHDQARRMGIPSAYRHVFLDSEVGTDYSREKLIELFNLARKNGRAVAIGHPFPETLRALKESRALARKYGIRLVLASGIITD